MIATGAPMLQMETPRLLLRQWRESDREPFAAMNADAETMTYFPAPMTPEESGAAIERYVAGFERTGFGFFATELRETGAFVGLIGMQVLRDVIPGLPEGSVEIGWRLDRRYHGQGLATEGARAVVEFAFRDCELPGVVALTAQGNQASRRVMEKLGMTYAPELDFDHPRMPAGHPHQRHALYVLANSANPHGAKAEWFERLSCSTHS